jgi:hypothetical protein
MPVEVAALFSEIDDADRVERLAALKARIMAALPKRVRSYSATWDGDRVSGLDGWGRGVVEDIWGALTAEATENDTEIPWQQIERNALADFAEDRARDFVGRRPILLRLESLASSPAQEGAVWGACVTAESGWGKSALFGELHRRLKGSGVLVLAHAAGASPRAASVDTMLRRWIDELATALSTDAGLPENADAETVETTFASLLGRTTLHERVVVLVDSLDQFETTTRGQFARWLPRLMPSNARLITTAIAGKALNALSERPGVELIPFRSSTRQRRVASLKASAVAITARSNPK